jgi:hypothetical protein
MGPEEVTKKETEKRRGEVSERKGQEIGDWRIARRFALRRRGAKPCSRNKPKGAGKKFEDIFWRLHDAGRLGINDAGL